MEAANLFTANLITATHQIMVTDPAATDRVMVVAMNLVIVVMHLVTVVMHPVTEVATEVLRDTDINMNVVVSGRSFNSCFNWNWALFISRQFLKPRNISKLFAEILFYFKLDIPQ